MLERNTGFNKTIFNLKCEFKVYILMKRCFVGLVAASFIKSCFKDFIKDTADNDRIAKGQWNLHVDCPFLQCGHIKLLLFLLY
jgi:hypothetical protein